MKTKITSTVVALFLFFIGMPVFGAKMKKVLLVDIINKEKNANFGYLEASITDAIRNKLKETFVFRETKKEKWSAVAKDNFLFKEEWDQKSVSMNLGLLTKQDILISGSFVVKSAKKKRKRKKGADEIFTLVRIFDISKKKIIADFTIKGYADGRIWDSVNEIADRIVKEASKVLPNKKDWAKKGIVEEVESTPWFSDFSIGFGIGGGLYFGGWSDYLQVEQPTLGASIKTHLPIITENFNFQIDFLLTRHSLKDSGNSSIQELDLALSTSNYFISGFLGYTFHLSNAFLLLPKIGGGYLLQNSTISGEYNSTVTNGIPFGAATIDILYGINKNIYLNLSNRFYVEFESSIITYHPNIMLGVELKL